MPIFKKKSKTFKEKREAFGVKRTTNINVSDRKGNYPMEKANIFLNPKLQKILANYQLERKKIQTKIYEVFKKKPRNEVEARKRKEDIASLSKKLNELQETKSLLIMKTNSERINARATRQEEIIYKKLYGILNNNQKTNLTGLSRNSSIDPSKLRKYYQEFLKSSGKSFSDISSSEAYKILKDSLIKTS